MEELRNEIDEQKAALDKSEKNRQRLQGKSILFHYGVNDIVSF